ncbi:nucleotidyltransferase domain-containing protein [Ensifer sp. B1-9]|uniref:nucleotidyltransferase domain-containing protein n=1 Tax=Ensifer sp. B1-9 TaxID=3141455 RepID=UPI003D1B67D2
MAIPERQLETWSHQPAAGPSRDTYRAVKEVLEDWRAPFADKRPNVFLQGSYGNDTNVARESDVDVVSMIDTTFAHDADTLRTEQYEAFQGAYKGSAAYSYRQYKADVTAWLITNYGKEVTPGKKAIFIPAGKNRRDCDVLPAIEYRYYYSFKSLTDQSYASGICFYLPDGTQIVNYPKQHSANCTSKHQQTDSWFKPTVRIYKNMRNCMIDRRVLPEGIAPSYFIEGMLYNVPTEMFGKSFQKTVAATYDFIAQADRSQFKCANGIHSLLGSTPVTWSATNCQTFLDALLRLWREWR